MWPLPNCIVKAGCGLQSGTGLEKRVDHAADRCSGRNLRGKS